MSARIRLFFSRHTLAAPSGYPDSAANGRMPPFHALSSGKLQKNRVITLIISFTLNL